MALDDHTGNAARRQKHCRGKPDEAAANDQHGDSVWDCLIFRGHASPHSIGQRSWDNDPADF